MLRIIRLTALGLIAAIALGWAVAWLRPDLVGRAVQTASSGFAGVNISGSVSVGGPFALVDSDGQPVTNETYRGRWMLIYFGYTFCPDVCPTELQVVANALDLLGADAAKVAPIFITVDPTRDTMAALAEYVKLFDPRLIGLTGTEAQVTAAARAYRVYYAKATPKESTTYLMDHSSFIYLMGPDGSFRGLYRQGTTPLELANAVRAKMAGS